MKVSELDKPFAAEVTDIDLSQPMSPDAFGEILAAWMEHPVLAFRDQNLDVDAQQKFSERFGQLKTRLRQSGQQGATASQNPYMMFVSNIKENGKLIGTSPVGALNFHSDSSFDERPSKAGLLYGIENSFHGWRHAFRGHVRDLRRLAARYEGILKGQVGGEHSPPLAAA